MELIFLGTGAGESYPGLWCECPHCTYARTHGGRNVRANSCALLDGRILLDMGPMSFHNAALHGVSLAKADTLLITHPHPDHLYPRHFHWRETNEHNVGRPYLQQMDTGGPRHTAVPTLNVFGNACTEEELRDVIAEADACRLTFTRVEPGKTYSANGVTFTPVPGYHGPKPGFANGYVIEKDGRTLLYALDSGLYGEEQMQILRRFHFDLVVNEGTTGLADMYGTHMSLTTNVELKRMLTDAGCIDGNTPYILTHMSPHWCPPYDWYEAIVAPHGFTLAYDGMRVTV